MDIHNLDIAKSGSKLKKDKILHKKCRLGPIFGTSSFRFAVGDNIIDKLANAY